MTAYQLADFIETGGENIHRKELVNMLRQQADRIAKLEGEVSHLKHINKNWSISEGLALQRIAELEKQGEPVAWWTGKYEDEGEDFMFPNTRQAHIDHPQSETHKFFSIPLYTTPQIKELSDEEIEQEWVKSCPDKFHTNLIGFARAILKKASEK